MQKIGFTKEILVNKRFVNAKEKRLDAQKFRGGLMWVIYKDYTHAANWHKSA